MKHLNVGDEVIAVFLGTPEACQVIEVSDKKNKLYKLQMKSGTKLPNVTWFKLLDVKEKKNKPWYILKYIKHIKPKVELEDTINKADLDNKIQEQKNFIHGNIKK
tara:strand:+ start:74 stop:388 length:315 start_codon:yes stop_codon:yes gene_type:complete